MTHRDTLTDLYKHMIANDVVSISALFPGPVSIDTPLSGAVDGIQDLDRLLNEEGDWLRMSDATATPFAITEDDRRVIIEFVVDLNHQGQPISLPVAVFGQKHEQGFGQIRVYHSTWPLDGSHKYRAPIVWPGEPLVEPVIIERYFSDLAKADKDDVLTLFSKNAHVREPAGDAYCHTEAEGRAFFYGHALGAGGIGLTHATATLDGRRFAVEYLCDSWGPLTFPPMAGCAFYELSGDGQQIEAVRIYDDVTPPAE